MSTHPPAPPIYKLATRLGELELTLAVPEDVAEARALMADVTTWLLDRGIRQWTEAPPTEYLQEKVRRGELYVARYGAQIVGILSLHWADPETWGARPDDAGYVHNLAVHRAFAGYEIGRRLLEWAEGQIAAAGRLYVRLDCWAENPALIRYYEQTGYVHQSLVEFSSWRGCLFEKAVGPHAAVAEGGEEGR
jgi:ribosomal protein S18 acetylase RimI-like enzyme